MSQLPVGNRTGGMDLVVHAGLYLMVASIPFEYPKRTIPLEIPTLTAAVFLLTTLFHPRRCYRQLPAPVLWFGAYLVAFLLAVISGQGEHAPAAVEEFVVVLQSALVFLAAGNLMQDEKVARRAMITLVAACSVRAALPLLGIAKTVDAVGTGGERITALGQNANSAAMILAAGLIALIGLTFRRRGRKRFRFILTGLLGALLGFAVLQTGSRGGLASLLAGVFVFALVADTFRLRLRNGAIAVLAISLLSFATLRLPVMKNRLQESITTGNMAGRERLYPALWTMFLEEPVIGWGPITNNHELAQRIGDRERLERGAHNLMLELLTATGLVGTIPLLLGVWLCGRGAWRARRGEHGVLPLALLASLLIANMSSVWVSSKLLWLVLAYAFASGTWRVASMRLRPQPPMRRVLASPDRATPKIAAVARVVPDGDRRGGR